MSAYFLFLNEQRPILKKENPNAGIGDISKLAGYSIHFNHLESDGIKLIAALKLDSRNKLRKLKKFMRRRRVSTKPNMVPSKKKLKRGRMKEQPRNPKRSE